MNKRWKIVKNILCIRPDNMGDVIMTTPAIRALKETFNAQITLLSSSSGSQIAKYIPEIDNSISLNAPWVKTYGEVTSSAEYLQLIKRLKVEKFDAAIIFNVFSQNPWVSMFTAYLANIPLRLAYSKEKPYELLTDWVIDHEPHDYILHEAQRQLNLVKNIGAVTNDHRYSLRYSSDALNNLLIKLQGLGINAKKKIIIIHPGVSSEKRRYSALGFAKAARELYQQTGYQIVYTGSKEERELAYEIQIKSHIPSTNLAGILSLEELIAFLDVADLLISNNTGPVHIASAMNTPVIDLYALTNPQHTPWMNKSEVLYFKVPKPLAKDLVSTQIPLGSKPLTNFETIVKSARKLLQVNIIKSRQDNNLYL
jgi:lipopolysaccharide heptosyltransferase II